MWASCKVSEWTSYSRRLVGRRCEGGSGSLMNESTSSRYGEMVNSERQGAGLLEERIRQLQHRCGDSLAVCTVLAR